MRRTSTAVPLAAAVAACALAGGCYRKVVGVDGPAAQHYDVEEASIGRGESVWSTDKPRPVDEDHYTGTTVDSARPLPSRRPSTPSTQP